MYIYLVRHTKVKWSHNYPYFHLPVWLSDEGRQHAVRIADWMKSNTDCPPIVSSPLVRTVQTAEIIAAKTHADVTIDSRLTEVACPDLQNNPDPNFSIENEEDAPSYEGYDAVLKRMLSLFAQVQKSKKDCVLVSHGTPLTLLYQRLANIPTPTHIWSSKEDPTQTIHKGEIIVVHAAEGASPKLERVAA